MDRAQRRAIIKRNKRTKSRQAGPLHMRHTDWDHCLNAWLGSGKIRYVKPRPTPQQPLFDTCRKKKNM